MYNPDAKQRTEQRDTGSVSVQENYVLITMKKKYITLQRYKAIVWHCNVEPVEIICPAAEVSA